MTEDQKEHVESEKRNEEVREVLRHKNMEVSQDEVRKNFDEAKVPVITVNDGAYGVRREKMDFPSNSIKSREAQVPNQTTKRVGKVVSGRVITKKKGTWKRIKEMFFGEEVENVPMYIIQDILIPAAKSTISDMVNGGIDMLLFGEVRGRRTSRDRDRTYVSYSSYYKSGDDRNRGRREISQRDRAQHEFKEITLETRGEAEDVISRLIDLIDQYGVASVADLYALVDVESSHVDEKWGWDNLSSASTRRESDGYILILPRAIVLD
jgi:hypothetical protein